MNNRRSPVRSVLAERRLFANGGMLPISTPMQNTMEQPSGILASSRPLIDVVVQEALNPDGSGTLSMAQGGAVGFANGGVQTLPVILDLPPRPLGLGQAPQAIQIPTLTPTLTQRGGSAIYDPVNPITMSPKSIMDETASERVRRVFPDAAANTGKLTFDQEFPEFKKAAETGRPKSYFTEGVAKVLQGSRAAVRDVVSEVGQDVSAIFNVLFDRDTRSLVEGASNQEGLNRVAAEIGIARVVAEMIQRRPDAENQIKSLAKTIIDDAKTEGTELDGQKIAEAVAYAMTTGEREQAIGYDMARRDAERVDVDAAADPAKAAQWYERAAYLEDPGYALAAFDEAIDEPGQLASTASSDPDTDRQAAEVATDTDPAVSSLEDGLAAFDEAIDEPGQLASTAAQAASTAFDTDGALDEVAAAASILDTDKKSDPKDFAAFKKEFMEAMPKFEGMSEEEKGFLIAEAGLRVMAGQSPNAITNIAEGLKGLGPELMKSEKEKRAWNRQVGLSAAKYALAGVDKEDAKADALAKEGRVQKTFVVGKSFTDPTGTFRPAGSLYRPDTAFTRTEQFSRNILPNLTTEGIWKEILDNKGKLPKLIRQVASGKGSPTIRQLEESFKEYNTLTDEARNSAKMLTMIDSSILINAAGNATGLTTWASSTLNKLKNSVGMKKELSILGKIGTEKGEASQQFRYQQQVIANMMLKEILGEGSKNVSNIDRDLAQQIVGLMSEWDSISTDEDLLNRRLQNIRLTVYNGLESRMRQMKSKEFSWQNVINTAGIPVQEEFSSLRGLLKKDIERLPGVATRTSKGQQTGVLRISDFYDFKTGKLKKKIPR